MKKEHAALLRRRRSAFSPAEYAKEIDEIAKASAERFSRGSINTNLLTEDALNAERGRDDLVVKIGIHEGPCLAVTLNDRQDLPPDHGPRLEQARACAERARDVARLRRQTIQHLFERPSVGHRLIEERDIIGMRPLR